MFRTVGLLSAASLALLLVGCPRDEAQPAPNYAGQPGYGAPQGYQPGYAPQPGYYDPNNPGGYAPQPGMPAPQPTMAPQPGMPAPQPTMAPQPAPAPAPAATAPGGFPFPFPGFPGAAPAPAAGAASGSASPIDPNVASAATIPLTALASSDAQGMQREGPTVAAQFQEGQTLEAPLQMLPGKCYTVLAVGAGITEMDISLVAITPLPGTSPVLAQDSGQGASASLGGRGNCFKWSWPVGINAKMVLKATKGSGIAAGQLYVK